MNPLNGEWEKFGRVFEVEFLPDAGAVSLDCADIKVE